MLGVSTDTIESHEKFRASLELPFPLLADTKGELSGMYDALIEHEGQPFSKRKLVLIDKGGMVRYRNESVKVGDDAHWNELLEAVKGL